MGKSQRDKGARGERELAELWREAGYPNARRAGMMQAQSASSAPDLLGTGMWWVECKRQANPNPVKALEQAREALYDHHGDLWITHHPVACTKRDRGQWMACFYLSSVQSQIPSNSGPCHMTLQDFFLWVGKPL